MLRYLTDQLLAFLRRRCEHPANMVAVDILEGCAPALELSYCNRCGAVKPKWLNFKLKGEWRKPDPNLWRG